jgi:hypothetical protein
MNREERFIFCNEESQKKMKSILEETNGIYQYILDKLYGQDKKESNELIEKTIKHIIEKENGKITVVMNKKIFDSAYIKYDPYYLVNFKSIYPLVKYMYFDKNVSLTMVKFNTKPIEMNQIMRELTGSAIDTFLRIFNHYGEEFYKILTTKDIEVNIMFKKFNTKGITKSIVEDIYRNMRATKKKSI